ncbi:MAG: hypothetical protein ACLTZT_14640 [Butyricimonas faecalis]
MAKELIQATAKLAQYDTITAIAPLDKEASRTGTARENVWRLVFPRLPASRKRMMILFGLPRSFLGQQR